MKYSKNKKLNTLLNCIESDVINAFNDDKDGKDGAHEVIESLEYYKKYYPGEIDYNTAQGGHLLVYFYQVYDLYRNCGYKITEKFSSSKIWETYRRQVGYVCNEILRNQTEFIAQF